MPEVVFTRLRCLDPEDLANGDEVKIDFTVDGSFVGSKSEHGVKSGDIVLLNQPVSFDNKVSVQLIDEDWPDPDDNLGEITILANQTASQGTFKGQNGPGSSWHYILEWDVVPPPPPVSPPQGAGNDDGSGTVNGNLFEVKLGEIPLPNNQRFCTTHIVDSQSQRIKVWIELQSPNVNQLQAAAQQCATAGAVAALIAAIATGGGGAAAAAATFEATFITCLKSKVGQQLAMQAVAGVKWKHHKDGWSGH